LQLKCSYNVKHKKHQETASDQKETDRKEMTITKTTNKTEMKKNVSKSAYP